MLKYHLLLNNAALAHVLVYSQKEFNGGMKIESKNVDLAN